MVILVFPIFVEVERFQICGFSVSNLSYQITNLWFLSTCANEVCFGGWDVIYKVARLHKWMFFCIQIWNSNWLISKASCHMLQWVCFGSWDVMYKVARLHKWMFLYIHIWYSYWLISKASYHMLQWVCFGSWDVMYKVARLHKWMFLYIHIWYSYWLISKASYHMLQ